jgi:hypothetical protein
MRYKWKILYYWCFDNIFIKTYNLSHFNLHTWRDMRKIKNQSILNRQAIFLKGGSFWHPPSKIVKVGICTCRWGLEYLIYVYCYLLYILLCAEVIVGVVRSKANSSTKKIEFASYFFLKKINLNLKLKLKLENTRLRLKLKLKLNLNLKFEKNIKSWIHERTSSWSSNWSWSIWSWSWSCKNKKLDVLR